MFVFFVFCFFFFKQKTAYEIMPSLVGSEMCIRTGLVHDPAIAAAGGAGTRHRQEPLRIALAPPAAARRAGPRLRSLAGPGPGARLAPLQARNDQRSRDAESRVTEGHLHPVANVASGRTGRTPAAEPGETEEVFEQAGEFAEPGGIEALGKAGTARRDSRVAEAIVEGALLRVGKNGVGFGCLLELLGGLGVVGVPVRMEPESEFPVGRFQLAVGGLAADAEDFVVVAPFSHLRVGSRQLGVRRPGRGLGGDRGGSQALRGGNGGSRILRGGNGRSRALAGGALQHLSLIHISEPTRLGMISYAVFCLKKK